jgi:hypothetical protein
LNIPKDRACSHGGSSGRGRAGRRGARRDGEVGALDAARRAAQRWRLRVRGDAGGATAASSCGGGKGSTTRALPEVKEWERKGRGEEEDHQVGRVGSGEVGEGRTWPELELERRRPEWEKRRWRRG